MFVIPMYKNAGLDYQAGENRQDTAVAGDWRYGSLFSPMLNVPAQQIAMTVLFV